MDLKANVQKVPVKETTVSEPRFEKAVSLSFFKARNCRLCLELDGLGKDLRNAMATDNNSAFEVAMDYIR